MILFLLSCNTVQRSNTPHGEQCLVHDHLYRCWNSHVPSDVPENPPLVIDMHYWTGDAEDQRGASERPSLFRWQGYEHGLTSDCLAPFSLTPVGCLIT